ncbi:hypothetical protein BDR26DRAFT_997057 [Obelidium mucronatum]|nr:hypothetical protein BDR26DRAFT_997057 [Obelidium mucronatum]
MHNSESICSICGKQSANAKSFLQHLSSKRHKDAAAAGLSNSNNRIVTPLKRLHSENISQFETTQHRQQQNIGNSLVGVSLDSMPLRLADSRASIMEEQMTDHETDNFIAESDPDAFNTIVNESIPTLLANEDSLLSESVGLRTGQIPLIQHSTLHGSNFSLLNQTIEPSVFDATANLKYPPYHPFDNQPSQDFMLHLVSKFPSVSNPVWNAVLSFIQKNAMELKLPTSVESGMNLLNSDDRYIGAGKYQKQSVGNSPDGGKEIFFHYRNILDCGMELLQKYYPDMAFTSDSAIVGNEKMYGEYNTGNWWEAQVRSLPPGAKLLAFEVYSDATELDGGHKTSGHPIYMSLCNIPRQQRNKPESKVAVGFLPKWYSTSSSAEKDTESFKKKKRDIFHKCYEILLAPIKKYQEKGFRMYLDVELLHFVPRLCCCPADQQEHTASALLYGPAGNMPCIECLIIWGYLHFAEFPPLLGPHDLGYGIEDENHEDNYNLMLDYDFKLRPRREDDMNRILNSRNAEKIKKYSLYSGTKNAFSGFLGSPLYQLFPSDYMLHDLAGLNKTIFEYTIEMIELKGRYPRKAALIKRKLAERFRSMPVCYNFRLPTNSITDSTNLTSKERDRISKVLLFPFVGLLTDQDFIGLSEVILPFLKFQKVLNLDLISESDLDQIQALTKQFCVNFDKFYAPLRNQHQIPKLHGIVHHLCDAIRNRGHPKNWGCSMYEHNHRFIKEDYKRRANKKAVVEGLTQSTTRRTVLARLDDSVDDKESEDLQAIPETRFCGYLHLVQIEEVRHNGIFSFTSESQEDLESENDGHDNGHSSVFDRFLKNIMEDLPKILDLFGAIASNISMMPDKDFKWLKVHSSAVKAFESRRIMANPNYHGTSRFTDVKLESGEYARVQGLISLSLLKKREGGVYLPRAWVQYFVFVDNQSPTKYDCNYVQLSNRKDLIHLEKIEEEVMMIPDFDWNEKNSSTLRFFENTFYF